MNFIQTTILTSIMLATSIFTAYLSKADDQPPLKSLSTFPMQIGEWHGKPARFEDKIYQALGVDDSILAYYQQLQTTNNIELYIGYYQSQREGDIIHSPKNCMPGAGWNIASIEPISLDITITNGKPIKINKVILQNGNQKHLMFYWFHSRGRVISSEYAQKIFLVWDSILRHRTDGSFVRLISSINDRNEYQVTEDFKQFTQHLFPVLSDFIPN